MFQFESKGHLQKHLKDSIVTEVTKRGNLRERFVAQIEKFLPVMQETQVWSLGQEDPPEKGMATHSSILARRIPWTEELVGYSS